MNQSRNLNFVALLLVHTVVANLQANDVLEESSYSVTRKLQQAGFNYRANYTADFHHLLHPSCAGNKPSLVVTCLKAENITFLGTSHPSILCSLDDIDFSGAGFPDAKSYSCSNTCSGRSCNEVYISTDTNGPYGSIQFMCEGNDYQQIEAAFVFIGGENGYCNTTNVGTTTPSTSNPNLHIAKLGVSCPSDPSSSGSSGDARKYVYDDTYFECGFTGSTSAFASVFDRVGDPSDEYACLTGNDCSGMACSDVLYNDIVVRSVVPKFLLPCVETTLQSITAIPSQSPIARVASANISKVRFVAQWGNLYDPETAPCQYDNTGVLISCENGASAIRFHNSTDSSIKCTNIADTGLHCFGNETKIKNQFTSVMYDCYGGNAATSLITFPATNVSCDNNDLNVLLRNSVIMGLACEGQPVPFYSDLLFECTDPSHQFHVSASGEFNLVGDRYICSESTIVPKGSSVLDVQIIPSVSIATDSLWLRDTTLQGQCSKSVDAIPTQTISLVPSLAPSPFKAPFNMPINAVFAPVQTSAMPSVRVPTVPTLDNSAPSPTIFAIIGGIAGGVVISLIVFFVYRKGKNDGSTKKQHNYSTGSNASTNQETQFNSDHLTRFSNSNKNPSSTSAAATAQTNTSSSDVHSQAGLLPTVSEPVIESNFYAVEYKDQARSVAHMLPVLNSARRMATGAMPIVTAVRVLDDFTDNANNSSVIKFNDIPSDVATRFDV